MDLGRIYYLCYYFFGFGVIIYFIMSYLCLNGWEGKEEGKGSWQVELFI